jgi:hypothetical protein
MIMRSFRTHIAAVGEVGKNGLSPRERRLLFGLLLVILTILVAFTVGLSARKSFSMDEFQYAHASWLVANGQTPYKDFFEVHFPLLYQYLAPFWFFADDNPANIGQLRFLMLPLLLLGLVSLARMAGGEEKKISSALAAAFALACTPFVGFATELRPDAAAFAFYAAALGVFYVSRLSARIRSFLGGFLLVAAFWASQKAWFYGLPFLVAWGLDIFATIKKRPSSGQILGRPLWVLGGISAGLLPILAYLSLTGSWGAIYGWCIKWAYEYQQRYPVFSWTRAFLPFLFAYPDYLVLGAFGIAGTVRKRRMEPPEDRRRFPGRGMEFLLVGSLLAAFLSFCLQRAPWGYSMIPFLGFLCLFVARGFSEALSLLLGLVRRSATRRILLGAAGVFLVGAFLRSGIVMTPFLMRPNSYQLYVLNLANQLMDRADSFYDNTGTIVSRPHAYFYFYTEKSIRGFEGEQLIREVPKAIEGTGSVVMMVDARYYGLPEPLKEYLDENFQSFNGDLRIWGHGYPGAGDHEFQAILDGEYFMAPAAGPADEARLASARAQGAIKIDGISVQDQKFRLAKGRHKIHSSSPCPFYILWLPRNHKMWSPHPKAVKRFFRSLGRGASDSGPIQAPSVDL